MDGYPVCAKCWNMHHDSSVHPAKPILTWAGAPVHCSHCGEPTNCGMRMFPGRQCNICEGVWEPMSGPYHEQGGLK